MSEIDRAAVVQIFLAEGAELLAAMETELLALESSPLAADRMKTLLRLAHTVKGNASLLSFDPIVELAHTFENALGRVTLPIEAENVSLMLAGVDGLRNLFQLAAHGESEVPPEVLALRGRLDGAAIEAPTSSEAPALEAQATTLRIDLERLDEMLELMGELEVARARVRVLCEAESDGRLRDALDELDKPLRGLQGLVVRARTVPIGPLLRPYKRLVRELAESHGKRAQLVVDGEDLEVDARVVQQLRDPLTHMIRNAIDHGIEPPAQRERDGKEPVGTLRLSARRESGRLHLELADDGAGLDRERILARAKERGLTVDPGDERRILSLVFEAGFSTAARVTALSGRGVGLDVVKRQVEALRGTVEIASQRGRGTSFHLRVPITVALVNCLAVDAGGETFLLPGEAVEECLSLDASEQARATGLLNVRGEALSWIRLADLFELGSTPAARSSVVVVRHGERRAGLVVDELIGEQQMMVKPLARLFQRAGTVSGSAVLGSGRVALLLDVRSVVQKACQTA
jgi:two-component system chemotaxis sensor kinase CheA